ncbi:hypothetical protein PHBOTO_006074 [Pseudozyma hubeiensis]|nr:hypothetical protein PHBOTO_006074 [Pseudozyma hubeiensis]
MSSRYGGYAMCQPVRPRCLPPGKTKYGQSPEASLEVSFGLDGSGKLRSGISREGDRELRQPQDLLRKDAGARRLRTGFLDLPAARSPLSARQQDLLTQAPTKHSELGLTYLDTLYCLSVQHCRVRPASIRYAGHLGAHRVVLTHRDGVQRSAKEQPSHNPASLRCWSSSFQPAVPKPIAARGFAWIRRSAEPRSSTASPSAPTHRILSCDLAISASISTFRPAKKDHITTGGRQERRSRRSSATDIPVSHCATPRMYVSRRCRSLRCIRPRKSRFLTANGALLSVDEILACKRETQHFPKATELMGGCPIHCPCPYTVTEAVGASTRFSLGNAKDGRQPRGA